MRDLDFRKLLESSLSESQLKLLQLVREEATQRGLPLYIVGGSVRDLALGRRLQDFDLTVEGNAIDLARSLTQNSARPSGSCLQA